MSKEKNVVEFYVLCNKLKNILRKGWLEWEVKAERVESVAEHIFGTQMLALAMWSEFHYEIDIKKVLFMLSIHEMEEILIGDLSLFDVDKETKKKLGHKAVAKVLSTLESKDYIESLIFEFDERKTPEALFAFQCDKLECDLQCKLYDERGCVDDETLNNKKDMEAIVKQFIDESDSWSQAWLKFGQKIYNYDKNFTAVSNYCMKNEISILNKVDTKK